MARASRREWSLISFQFYRLRSQPQVKRMTRTARFYFRLDIRNRFFPRENGKIQLRERAPVERISRDAQYFIYNCGYRNGKYRGTSIYVSDTVSIAPTRR